MRRVLQILAGMSLAHVGLLFGTLARADSVYTFSIVLQSGITGTALGTLDLRFVSPGGTWLYWPSELRLPFLAP
jgi:hypothetical protein